MNQQNAQYSGGCAGRALQNKTSLTPQEYEEHGERIAASTTRTLATRVLYLKGWNEAWIEPSTEAPTPHNPNTRFCACQACMA